MISFCDNTFVSNSLLIWSSPLRYKRRSLRVFSATISFRVPCKNYGLFDLADLGSLGQRDLSSLAVNSSPPALTPLSLLIPLDNAPFRPEKAFLIFCVIGIPKNKSSKRGGC